MKTICIHLQTLPPYTPEGALFLAGNVNNWAPADPAFRLQPRGDGSYGICLRTELDILEYKITRGHWATAEGDKTGGERPNRVYKTGDANPDSWIQVESWTDLPQQARQFRAPDNVVLLHSGLYMPQLGRRRRIWACLPADYWTGARRYPVVYMTDGQNLFDNPEATFGSWNADRALNRLFLQPGNTADIEQPILIGIENGGDHRIEEYAPWPHPEHGGGRAAASLDFLVNTLKPFVDARLRTRPGRAHTGVMGSSMGGLFALYAAFQRPDLFGMAGAFSPSLWFSDDIYRLAEKTPPGHPVRLLLLAGREESPTMVGDLLRLQDTLRASGHSDRRLHLEIHPDGAHAEWFWAREFEHALNWLFEDGPEYVPVPGLRMPETIQLEAA